MDFDFGGLQALATKKLTENCAKLFTYIIKINLKMKKVAVSSASGLS